VFDKWNMSIDLICTSEGQVSMALHPEVSLMTGDDEDDSKIIGQDLIRVIAQLQEHGDVELLHDRTIISLIGKQMRRALSVTGQMFSTLSENRINIDMISHGRHKCWYSQRRMVANMNIDRSERDKHFLRSARSGRRASGGSVTRGLFHPSSKLILSGDIKPSKRRILRILGI
jgi:hypothetical protein